MLHYALHLWIWFPKIVDLRLPSISEWIYIYDDYNSRIQVFPCSRIHWPLPNQSLKIMKWVGPMTLVTAMNKKQLQYDFKGQQMLNSFVQPWRKHWWPNPYVEMSQESSENLLSFNVGWHVLWSGFCRVVNCLWAEITVERENYHLQIGTQNKS
jgi:hypothetical protein